ncbi:hypothetical protein [Amycolatopsis sp. NPDC001319]|uniref:hypothetical protein n=1 Tax=unclassified Amycolatopsis TaxID=2618356 RepID=UPI0036D15D8C
MIDTKGIATRLQRWAATQDAPVRAAVNVLAEQGHWLGNSLFVEACVHEDEFDNATYISWWQLENAIDDGKVYGSSGEMAVLRFALFLAGDELGMSSLGSTNRKLVATEFARALGVQL